MKEPKLSDQLIELVTAAIGYGRGNGMAYETVQRLERKLLIRIKEMSNQLEDCIRAF